MKLNLRNTFFWDCMLFQSKDVGYKAIGIGAWVCIIYGIHVTIVTFFR